MKRLTRRFIISSLNGLDLSEPIRYERYYINDKLRIQRKNNEYQKEILDAENEEEKDNYIKESWMGDEITNSPLGFDKYLSKLSYKYFKEELKKYSKE